MHYRLKIQRWSRKAIFAYKTKFQLVVTDIVDQQTRRLLSKYHGRHAITKLCTQSIGAYVSIEYIHYSFCFIAMSVTVHWYSALHHYLPRLKILPLHKDLHRIALGTNVRDRVVNAGLLARSQFASGRSCDRPTRLWFSLAPE
jgi:hypothetical protein